MKNLDQIRAKNALDHRDKITESQGGGDAISGFPMLILTGGLLAALAFACESRNANNRKHPGEFTVATAITEHLKHTQIAICTSSNADALLTELANEESDSKLRRATAEALAFLNYLKRFVA